MASRAGKKKRVRIPRLGFEQRILWRALFLWLPTFVVMVLLLWLGNYSTQTKWTAVILLSVFAIGMALALREFVLRPLQTVANMLAAIREEDFSFKARRGAK